MGEEEKNPNPIYIGADLVEEIFVRLPLKSILRFKTVSKQWRSTVESRRFAEMRMSVQKNQKLILAVGNRPESRRFQGDAEIEMVYLQCDDATRPSLTCNGFVCFPEPDWVNVLNPLTGEYLEFYSGPSHYDNDMPTEVWWSTFNVYSAMGFGKDEVNGNYKIVSLSFDHNCFKILDVNIGQWRKLVTPPYLVEPRRKSACVNGSIYWLTILRNYKILALDLHTEEFRDVPVPPPRYTAAAHIVNLENRLAMADTTNRYCGWKLEIWIMDAQEQSWSLTYCINLSHRFISEDWNRDDRYRYRWFTPVAVSKQGSLFLCDNEKSLFKYDPETDFLRCLSTDICVISPFVENWVRLQPGSVLKTRPRGYRYERSYLDDKPCSRISSIVRRIQVLIPNILVTSTLVSLICFGFGFRYRT